MVLIQRKGLCHCDIVKALSVNYLSVFIQFFVFLVVAQRSHQFSGVDDVIDLTGSGSNFALTKSYVS